MCPSVFALPKFCRFWHKFFSVSPSFTGFSRGVFLRFFLCYSGFRPCSLSLVGNGKELRTNWEEILNRLQEMGPGTWSGNWSVWKNLGNTWEICGNVLEETSKELGKLTVLSLFLQWVFPSSLNFSFSKFLPCFFQLHIVQITALPSIGSTTAPGYRARLFEVYFQILSQKLSSSVFTQVFLVYWLQNGKQFEGV